MPAKDKQFNKLVTAANLMEDLNEIIDFCVGNQAPTDVPADGIGTLPELIGFIESYPKNKRYLQDGINQLDKLESKVLEMKQLLIQWSKLVDYLDKK